MCEATGYSDGTKSFLDKVGRPKTKQDLAALDWVSFGDVDEMIGYLNALQIPLTETSCRVSSRNGLVAWELAKAGLGLCPMDSAVGDSAIGMERVLPTIGEITFPTWLVAHREIHTSPKIRLVFDVLAQCLADRNKI